MNNDCLFYVFGFLDVGSIVNCSFVCSRFYKVINNEMLWKQLFDRYAAALIPKGLIGNNTMINVTFDLTNIEDSINLREIGTHDFFPLDNQIVSSYSESK